AMSKVVVQSEPPALDLAKRPGFGKAGRPITIETNYFQIKSYFTGTVFQYDIDISPKPYELKEGEKPRPQLPPKKFPPRLCRLIFDAFLTQYSKSRLDGIPIAYDGSKIGYTTKRLPLKDRDEIFEVSFSESGGGKVRTYLVKFLETTDIDMSVLQKLIKGAPIDTSLSSSALRVLDTVLYQDISKTHVKVGRSFFSNAGSTELGEGVALWRGIFQAAKPGIDNLFLNVDVANTAFYIESSVIDFVLQIMNLRSPSDLRSKPEPERMNFINRLLKGLTLVMNHRDRGSSRFKAKGLSDRGADQINFDITDAKTQETKKISVAQYLRDRYKISLQFPFLPCIEFGRGNYLPMELCNIAPGQNYKRKLNEMQTAEMIKHACQKPRQRKDTILKNYREMDLERSNYMREFKFSVSGNMSKVQARVLNTPRVVFAGNDDRSAVVPNNGVWNMRGNRVYRGVELVSWAVMVFCDQRRAPIQQIKGFLTLFVTACTNSGIKVVNNRPEIEYANPMANVETQMKKVVSKLAHTSGHPPQIVLCVLPSTSPVLYGRIKRTAYTEIGIHTQCMIQKHTFKPNIQYCANLALKVNVKLGGISYVLQTGDLPKVRDAPTIVFGADVTHPGVGETERPSIAAVVASMDARLSRYKAILSQQPARTEIIQNLSGIVRDQLIAFYRATKHKPAKIIFYRDGVSDGQLSHVMSSEVQAIRDACALLEPTYKPKITFIVVQKRHRTRLFPIRSEDTERSGNCMPGTVVDTSIVSPAIYDFYLQSHSGIQGTSKCTHYIVLKDDNGFTPDELQALSYNMCYLYAICTRSVSIVPSVYYAHRVAFRARSHTSDLWANSEEGSVMSGQPGSEKTFDFKLLSVKSQLADSMYFM
ncbi:hypothetical protein BB560_002963, partial [Smittium megazygosporum]